MVEYFLLAGLIIGLFSHAIIKKKPIIKASFTSTVEGLNMLKRIIPVLTGYLLAFTAFRAVGGLHYLLLLLQPVLHFLRLPDGILPLLLSRPFSGALSTAVFAELVNTTHSYLLSLQAAVMLGSTETTLYIVAIYFAYVQIKRTRYAIPLGLMLDLLGCCFSVYFCAYWFAK